MPVTKNRLAILAITLMLLVSVMGIRADEPATCDVPTGSPTDPLTFHAYPQEPGDFDAEILEYLNITFSAADLETAIETANRDTTHVERLSAEVVEAELTGDNRRDVLVNTVSGYGGSFESVLTLFTCTETGYVVLDTLMQSGMDVGMPPVTIVMVADTRGDGRHQIFVRSTTVEGMKGHDALRVYEWDGSGLATIYTFGPDYGIFSGIHLMNQDNNRATLELILGDFYGYGQATALATIEISHSRPINIVVGWQDGKFDVTCQYFTDTPTTLYETLHSAEAYRACGDDRRALEAYQHLWYDADLTAWEGPWIHYPDDVTDEAAYSAALERAYLRAFAGYRMLQIYLAWDLPQQAAGVLENLVNEYAPNTHGYQYAAMAQALMENYQAEGDLDAACDAAAKMRQRVIDAGGDPGIDYYEDVFDGKVAHYGYYFFSGKRYASDPDNLFDVPVDVADMISIPVCLVSED